MAIESELAGICAVRISDEEIPVLRVVASLNDVMFRRECDPLHAIHAR